MKKPMTISLITALVIGVGIGSFQLGAGKLMAVSSDPAPGSARRAKEPGFDAFMPKPVGQAEFVPVLKMVFGDHREAGQIIARHLAEELSCKDLKILAVEDNVVNRKLISVMLEKNRLSGGFGLRWTGGSRHGQIELLRSHLDGPSDAGPGRSRCSSDHQE